MINIFNDWVKRYVKNKISINTQNTKSGIITQKENSTFVTQTGYKDIVKQSGITDTTEHNDDTKPYKSDLTANQDLLEKQSLKVKDELGRNDKINRNIGTNLTNSYRMADNKTANRVINKHGLQLAEEVRHACASERVVSNTPSLLHYIHDDRTLYCPVEKVGTTFWRRIVYIFSSKNPDYKFPFDVPEEFAHIRVKREFSRHIKSPLSRTAFSFLFVRNPFSRLLSAYIDKIVAPNPYYWRQFGNLAIKRYRQRGSGSYLAGHSITFSEFIKLAIDSESTSLYSDPHIKGILSSCNPCLLNYSFIGRMETFKDDALYVLKKLNTNQDIVKSIEKEWEELSIEAAIKFNIEYCFNSKKEIMNYVTWEHALQRLWLHLQMRGIISKKLKLYHPEKNINTLNAKEFVELAVEANKASNNLELKTQKLEVQREAFASVHISDLERFVKAFRKDFELFGYDSHPSIIFQRGSLKPTPQFFNYTHLNR